MTTRVAAYQRAPRSADTALFLPTDLTRDPLFLRGRVTSGPAFAAAMLVLGKVARTAALQSPKDHSEYQRWVEGEYLKELPQAAARARGKAADLRKRELQIAKQISVFESEIWDATHKLDDRPAIRRFYDWLYEHDREAWICIDPVVSVQEDATFFEAFSIDESIYARVKLPHTSIQLAGPIRVGTTNIDFGTAFERELSRVRSYRPLDLQVGAESVQVETEMSSAMEKKIELPDSWTHGLVEVQSALVYAPVHFSVSSAFLSEVIALLESRRERHGPRSLVFHLEPEQPIRIEIQPWDLVVTDRNSRYSGSEAKQIRIWGRRRLFVMKNLLPDASRVRIHLLGNGMPSFWSLKVDDVELTIGLSGWTALDWASRVRFSALIPSPAVSKGLLQDALQKLKQFGRVTGEQLAADMNITVVQARGVLQKLCLAGKAMLDPETSEFRWRELFPEFEPDSGGSSSGEEAKGLKLRKSVTITSDRLEGDQRLLSATVTDGRPYQTRITMDADWRVVHADCTCSHFRYHKLRQGPCRHMVAMMVA